MAVAPLLGINFILLLGLGGGLGLPLGVPPLPEDAVCAKVAPADCLLYISWAGMAAPDAKSGNHTEQLLAEPEMQRLVTEVERLINVAIGENTRRQGPEATAAVQDAVKWAKVLASRPAALYVSDVKIAPGGPPEVVGGIVVNVGDEAANLKPAIEKYLGALTMAARLNVQKAGADGDEFYDVSGGPVPPLSIGLRGKYFIVAIGKGEREALLKRAAGSPPDWLTGVKKQLPVERVSTVSYINVKAIVEKFGPLAGPQLPVVLDATGLAGITNIVSVTGLDKTGFVSRSLVATSGELKGVLHLAAQKPLTAADLAGIPRDASFAIALKCDPQELFSTVVEVVGKIEPRAKAEMERGLAQVEQGIGLNLQNDILKSLGDTWRLFDSPSGGGMFTGVTAVVSLKDANTAKSTHQRLLGLAQGMLMRPGADPRRTPRIETFECAGQTVYSLQPRERDVFVAPTWCLTDKELIVGLYPQAVKAYLMSGDAPSLAKLPEVAAALEGDGTLMLAYSDQRRLAELIYPFLPVAAQALANEMQREGIDVSPSLLPSAKAILPHLTPQVATVRRTAAGIELTSRQTLPGSGFASAPVMTAMLLPAVGHARLSARNVQSLNNLRQVSLAMLNYDATHNTFPPAFSADKEGKPLLSWRVHILPYIEGDALYRQFKLDEPWDSEHNKRLIQQMPAVYRSAISQAGPGMTTYLTVRGEKTAFPGVKGVKLQDITDGASNTIMVVEVPDAKAVPWTKPDDFAFDPENPVEGLRGTRPEGFQAAFCDGHVEVVPFCDKQTLKNLFERNDGNPVNLHGPEMHSMPPGMAAPKSSVQAVPEDRPPPSVREERVVPEPARPR